VDIQKINEIKEKLDEMKCKSYSVKIDFDDNTEITIMQLAQNDKKIGF
jgi:hypothetical protein